MNTVFHAELVPDFSSRQQQRNVAKKSNILHAFSNNNNNNKCCRLAHCPCGYLLSCPACFAKVTFPCLGERSIVVMFIELSLLLILFTAVNTAGQRERERG